ncbi:MAG TPA: hypothetical protein VIP80_02600 [Gemmatimonadales bacterium]|jgi:glucose/arabinose dehydrogenase
MSQPLIGFPGHWAPNALVFYQGSQFPARYRGGAFVAFHGSWNRLPLAEDGYRVVFAPLADGRPAGLAEAPDGALFISDDMQGRIWRVTWGPPAR